MTFTVGMTSWNDRPDVETANLNFLLLELSAKIQKNPQQKTEEQMHYNMAPLNVFPFIPLC